MKQGPEAAEPGTMFVQEEKIFAGKVLRLHVCTMEGAEWLEEVPEDTTVEKLKERCLKHVRNRVSRPVPRAGAAPCAPGEPSRVCGRGGGKIAAGGKGRQVPVGRKTSSKRTKK